MQAQEGPGLGPHRGPGPQVPMQGPRQGDQARGPGPGTDQAQAQGPRHGPRPKGPGAQAGSQSALVRMCSRQGALS